MKYDVAIHVIIFLFSSHGHDGSCGHDHDHDHDHSHADVGGGGHGHSDVEMQIRMMASSGKWNGDNRVTPSSRGSNNKRDSYKPNRYSDNFFCLPQKNTPCPEMNDPILSFSDRVGRIL